MRLDSNLQVEAVNKGLDAPSLAMLIHLHSNWFLEEVKGIDLQNRYPLLFRSSVEVRKAFDIITAEGFLIGNFVSGTVKDIELNKEAFAEFFTSNQTVIKREKVKRATIKDVTPIEVLDIVKYYNTFPEMPRPATLTASNKAILNDKLKSLSKEEIIEAIKYADSAKWVKGKLDDKWMNMSWILRNIEGFCDGGKYRTSPHTISRVTEGYTQKDMDDIVVF